MFIVETKEAKQARADAEERAKRTQSVIDKEMSTTTSLQEAANESSWRVKRAIHSSDNKRDDIYAQIARLEAQSSSGGSNREIKYGYVPSLLAPSSNAARARPYNMMSQEDTNATTLSSSSTSSVTTITSEYTRFSSLDDEAAMLDAFSVLSLNEAETKLVRHIPIPLLHISHWCCG
jgi:hypothetical protein